MLSCADLGAALQSVGNNQTPSSSEMNGIVGYGRKAGGALQKDANRLNTALHGGGLNAYAKAMGNVGQDCHNLGLLDNTGATGGTP